jgi:predicted transcriptional regulator/YHS domain-containing protein
MPLRDVARLMRDFDCGEIPVVDGSAKRPVGVVTDRDIACRAVAQGSDLDELSARDCMSTPVVTVTPETSIEDCCNTMEARQIRRVPVVDQAGSCCGIVSQADVALHASARQSAEVVREVSRPARPPAQPSASMATDPVCGMQIATDAAADTETFAGERFYFCSTECRDRFRERPGDYAAPPSSGV